jgi:hypothetical protein
MAAECFTQLGTASNALTGASGYYVFYDPINPADGSVPSSGWSAYPSSASIMQFSFSNLPAATQELYPNTTFLTEFDLAVRADGSIDTAEGIACWFLDTDYNEESFFVRHAYFLGANDPYKALKTTLKAEINEEAWATLNSVAAAAQAPGRRCVHLSGLPAPPFGFGIYCRMLEGTTTHDRF